MLSLTPFLFGLFACMIDPEQDKIQDTLDPDNESTTSPSETESTTDADGDGITADNDCDDGNSWVSEDCGRTCTGDFELTTDEDLKIVAGCAVVNGDLDIDGLTQSDLEALNHLENITCSLLIMNNESLETTDGLDNLVYVGEDLLISFNNSLLSLDGLNALQQIGSTLSVTNSESLSDIQGLNGVTEVGDSILLNNIPITDLSALNRLQTLGASLYISDCTEIESLTDIVTNLTSFGENDTIGTYDAEGYMVESLFYVYNNDRLCETAVTQTTTLFENMGWEGRAISYNNTGNCD